MEPLQTIRVGNYTLEVHPGYDGGLGSGGPIASADTPFAFTIETDTAGQTWDTWPDLPEQAAALREAYSAGSTFAERVSIAEQAFSAAGRITLRHAIDGIEMFAVVDPVLRAEFYGDADDDAVRRDAMVILDEQIHWRNGNVWRVVALDPDGEEFDSRDVIGPYDGDDMAAARDDLLEHIRARAPARTD